MGEGDVGRGRLPTAAAAHVDEDLRRRRRPLDDLERLRCLLVEAGEARPRKALPPTAFVDRRNQRVLEELDGLGPGKRAVDCQVDDILGSADRREAPSAPSAP